MKKSIFITALLLVNTCVFAQTAWTLDPGHSKVGFTVTHHMISEVDGYFKEYAGNMTATREDFSDAVFELTVQTASLNTENQMRDGHLKSPGEIESFSLRGRRESGYFQCER